jgi:hypothetical protein
MAWRLLGGVAPSALSGARREAHWAAQLLSAAGETFVPHVPDTSHTAMSFDARRGALVGRELPGGACRVALRPSDLTLLLLARRGAVAELALAGRTLAEAERWTSEAVKAHTRGALDRRLIRPDYALDPHPLGRGGRFEQDPGLPELARWFANAAAELRRLARESPEAGEVLCWPHHFDIASLFDLEKDARGESLRSIGVGLSPGDDLVPEPYWYVNHDPVTARSELPELAAGGWLREGDWVGAVLRGSELVAAGGAAAQQARLRRFLGSAIPASRGLALG